MAAALVLAACGVLACNSPSGPPRPLSAQEERGRQVFQTNCSVCHDPYSTKPRAGPGLRGLFRRQFLPSGAPANDERVRATIMSGRRNMPPFSNILDDRQMQDLMAFLHAL